ncbi:MULTISPECIES: hypothetical protein [Streptomyces]
MKMLRRRFVSVVEMGYKALREMSKATGRNGIPSERAFREYADQRIKKVFGVDPDAKNFTHLLAFYRAHIKLALEDHDAKQAFGVWCSYKHCPKLRLALLVTTHVAIARMHQETSAQLNRRTRVYMVAVDLSLCGDTGFASLFTRRPAAERTKRANRRADLRHFPSHC